MSKLNKDAVLQELENAQTEYEQVYAAAVSAYEELDASKDLALTTIESVEALASSISNYPVLFRKKISGQLKEIQSEVSSFNEKEVIVREKRNKDIAAGATSVAALGVGAVLITSFKDYWNSKFKLDNKWGKNIAVWIVILLLIVVTFAIYGVAKLINNVQATKKAAKNTKKILREIERLKVKSAGANELSAKITDTRIRIDVVYSELTTFAGMRYKDIPSEHHDSLKAIINITLGLAKLANSRIE